MPNVFISGLSSIHQLHPILILDVSDGKHVGGCDDTLELQNSGKLAKLIDA